PPIRELRELTRYRRTQIDARAAEIQRLEKVLQDAGIKLTSVASRELTQSGRAMIEALIAGERDGATLAELAKGKLRPKIPALTEALTGRFGSHHAVACRRILGHLDFLNESVAALTEQVDLRTAAFAPIYALLSPVPGLDRLTIDVIIAETGADMSRSGERAASSPNSKSSDSKSPWRQPQLCPHRPPAKAASVQLGFLPSGRRLPSLPIPRPTHRRISPQIDAQVLVQLLAAGF